MLKLRPLRTLRMGLGVRTGLSAKARVSRPIMPPIRSPQQSRSLPAATQLRPPGHDRMTSDTTPYSNGAPTFSFCSPHSIPTILSSPPEATTYSTQPVSRFSPTPPPVLTRTVWLVHHRVLFHLNQQRFRYMQIIPTPEIPMATIRTLQGRTLMQLNMKPM
jgi:hypothetical protein